MDRLRPEGGVGGPGPKGIPYKAYLQAHPAGLGHAFRLYWAYGKSLFLKLLAPKRFTAVGLLIPGRGNLTVSLAGVLVSVRPRTNDLDLLVHHEPKVARWFQVKPQELVVDVGAHIGRYTLLAAKSASRVIAIEPDPSNFSVLSNNVRMNGFTNVVALRVALSRAPGRHRLYLADGSNRGTSSLEPEWVGDDGGRSSIEVECDTLDHLSESLGIRWIDWLKIDVEGHEVAVLEGAKITLTRTRHLALEVSHGNAAACASLMESAGLVLVGVEDGYPTSNWLLEARA